MSRERTLTRVYHRL